MRKTKGGDHRDGLDVATAVKYSTANLFVDGRWKRLLAVEYSRPFTATETAVESVRDRQPGPSYRRLWRVRPAVAAAVAT